MTVQRMIFGLIIIAAILGGVIIIRQYYFTQPKTTSITQEYSSSVYGISFTFPLSYTLAEKDVSGSSTRKHHSITLTSTAELPVRKGWNSS